MMPLDCRSLAGPVRSSLGKRVPQTRNAQLGVNRVTSANRAGWTVKKSSYIEPERCRTRSSRVVDLVLPRFHGSEDDLKIAGSRKIVARGAMRSLSYRSDWQRLCLQPQEEGNLVPAFHTAAFTSRVRHGLSQRCDGQAHIFQRGHIAFQGL